MRACNEDVDKKAIRVTPLLTLEILPPDFFGDRTSSFLKNIKILVSMSMCKVLYVYCLSFSMNKLLIGEGVVAGEHKVLLGLIGAAFGAITRVLYHSSFL